MLESANKLKKCSVDCLVLCANTLHQYVEALEKEINVPVVHIADATAREIIKYNIFTIGLLGTKFTMEMDFYTKRLTQKGIGSIVPEKGLIITG